MPAFIKIFEKRGLCISVFDTDRHKAARVAMRHNSIAVNSVSELVDDSDTVIICAPINTVPGIVEDVSEHAEKELNLVEISSIKNKSVAALRCTPENILPLSVHPMFGPDMKSFTGATVAVVPVADKEREVKLAREIFTGAEFKVLSCEAHDRSMAMILSLPYFMNSAFVRCVKGMDLPLLKQIAGPTFRTQLALSECILGEDPSFVESLIEDNVYARDALSGFLDELKYLRRMLKRRPGRLAGYYRASREDLEADPDYVNARGIRDLFLQEAGK